METVQTLSPFAARDERRPVGRAQARAESDGFGWCLMIPVTMGTMVALMYWLDALAAR